MGDLQDLIEDGGTFHIFLAYFSGLNFRGYPPKIWPYMLQYLHFRILEISH